MRKIRPQVEQRHLSTVLESADKSASRNALLQRLHNRFADLARLRAALVLLSSRQALRSPILARMPGSRNSNAPGHAARSIRTQACDSVVAVFRQSQDSMVEIPSRIVQ
ncbi:hypothetical protein [Ensifer sp.]|jgi:hypothetical protein|uniref:hypothetical protein n=1 Tax=Ensifer sp. TaxID=1872086 RepID=UPI002E10C5E3